MASKRRIDTSWLIAVATLMLFLGRQGIAQSGIVSLQVVDDATDRPIPEVRVVVLGERTEGVTDAAGRYAIRDRPPGRLAVVLQRLGYMPGTLMVDVSTSDTTRVVFAMSRAAQSLGTVDIRDSVADFWATTRQYPNVPQGTRDPYVPGGGGD